VNSAQKRLLFEKIHKHFNGDVAGKHFAVWGLSFKPKTDDMREAPSLVLIDRLLAEGATVCAFDPEAAAEAERRLGKRIAYAETALDALQDADALVLVTEWSEFRHVDPAEVKARLRNPIVFDGRNVFDPARMRQAGFVYHGIGVR